MTDSIDQFFPTRRPRKDREPEVLKLVRESLSTHEMKILHEDGIYRHVSFRRKDGASWYYFELVTWPGSLVIHGDMGTYTFTRINDMFEFFVKNGVGKGVGINAHYWAEKCTAGGIKELSADKIIGQLLDEIQEAVDSDVYDLTLEDVEGAIVDLDELFEEIESGMYDTGDIADKIDSFTIGDWEFQGDAWEMDYKDYTHQFLFCLNCIVWGIKKYRGDW